MKQLLVFIGLAITICLFTQCTKEEEIQELRFIGDSHVARWDVGTYFPDYYTYNAGISGSSLKYIEKNANNYIRKNVVVIIGTNDFSIASNGVDEYVERYVRAICGLGARKLFVFSIFPNNPKEYSWNTDQKDLLEIVNYAIKNKISSEYPNIVYIDVYDKLLYNGYLNPEYSSDGLHLNEQGYELITQEMRRNL